MEIIENQIASDITEKNETKPRLTGVIFDLLLLIILIIGAGLRLTGINWDEGTYLHPDERFLVMVESGISPVKCVNEDIPVSICPEDQKSWLTFAEYLDTAKSSMNPHNRGFGFFVYGTLPIFMLRYAAEWVGQTAYGNVHLVGRPFSTVMDLLVVLLVYLIGSRVYDRRVGLLGAAFSAFAVLQIQLSHFFTVDTFTNFFTWLAVYFAVRVAVAPARSENDGDLSGKFYWRDLKQPIIKSILFFGIALGMAVASKISSAPVAFLLPAAGLLYLSRLSPENREKQFLQIFIFMGGAAVLSLLVFRIFQPYAFQGPGLFDIAPNELWLDNLRALRAQVEPDSGFPPSIQWFDRPVWFSGKNLILWGVGAPFGFLALISYLVIGWRILKGDWRKHILLWGWAGVYFVWQSTLWNPTMRYQLPVYPGFALFAGWGLVALWDWGSSLNALSNLLGPFPDQKLQASFRMARWIRWGTVLFGLLVLGGTFLWAFGFTRIYTRQITRIEASRWIYQNIPGPLNLKVSDDNGNEYTQPIPYAGDLIIQAGINTVVPFTPKTTGLLETMTLGSVDFLSPGSTSTELYLTLTDSDNETQLASSALELPVGTASGYLGDYHFKFDVPVRIEGEKIYYLTFNSNNSDEMIQIRGAAIANETSWDDGLPMRIDGFDGFGGIYQGGLNFEMYWPDDVDKRVRFINTLNQADVVIISSSRQWGSLPRLPEKYPLTSTYYRQLLGCPAEYSIEWCFNVAEVGKFDGQLGFDLIEVYQSDPQIGPIKINDQFAEEAFTVYDHPKVFVFIKNRNYNPLEVGGVFNTAPLAGDPAALSAQGNVKTLLLPEDRKAIQYSGGTWSELFNENSIINRSQFMGTLVWYIVTMILGLAAYPIVRWTMGGLADRGYPFSRTVGMLLLAYFVWLAGSFEIAFSKAAIWTVFLVITGVGGVLAYQQASVLKSDWKQNKKYYLFIELLALTAFLFFLFIRLGNPDLWHPWKGGEKPMDFSYFNAVLKSTSFPPYDPWFEGGYINYYYFGFVFVATLTKGLGIIPAFAYNLIIPTLFMLTVLGAFSLGWNLYKAYYPLDGETPDIEEENNNELPTKPMPFFQRYGAYAVGVFASLGVAVLGNLGTVRMIFRGYQKLASEGVPLESVWFLQRWIWAFQGFFRTLSGDSLPYYLGDWYWIPSRAIPAPGEIEPITEFPIFTFLYADLHAHMLALPLTLLALGWGISVVVGNTVRVKDHRFQSWARAFLGLAVGGLIIGALRPTNTWDFPTYLVFGSFAVGYSVWRSFQSDLLAKWLGLSDVAVKFLVSTVFIGALGLFSFVFFKPFSDWYVLGYTDVNVWKGTHTPLMSYLTHWGLFLFVILSWMVWETRDWLATTPISALAKFKRYRTTVVQGLIFVDVVLITVLLTVLFVLLNFGAYTSIAVLIWPVVSWMLYLFDVPVLWAVLPLIIWAGLLLLRPGLSDSKKITLFMVGTGLFLTVMVEVIVLSGDIARMNTVFKFYLQVWILMAVASAAAFGWVLHAISEWTPGWRQFWQAVIIILVLSAGLFPLTGGASKIKDRMSVDAPITLDGLAYMPFSVYDDQGQKLFLDEDYRAIRWMQENVIGSPVIVEANTVEYRWGSRFTINTGLPGVVGWNWHQRQQRTSYAGDVMNRVGEIDLFYMAIDIPTLQDFLTRYEVKYIIVGQLERANYAGPGIDKFDDLEGLLWQTVYQDGQTKIYEVIP